MQVEFEQTASLGKFIIVLFKHKWIILSVFIAIVLIVTIGTLILPPVYEASSKILLEREIDAEKALLFRMNFPQSYDNYDWVNSEIEIINSYPVASRVVKNLKLDQLAGKKKLTSETEKAERFENAVKGLIKKLEINKIKDSNMLEVSYEAENPKLAASIVNKVIENYIQCRLEISDKSNNYNFFEEQICIADEKLREFEQRQAEFKRQEQVISPKEHREILLTRLIDFERSLTAVQTKRIGKASKLAVIKRQFEKGHELSIPATEVSDSPSREKHVTKLKGELLNMELQREQLLQKFTPKFKEVINLDKQIAAIKLKIKSEIQQIIDMEETSIRALKTEEDVLQNSVDKIKEEIQEFAQKEYEYAQISRGIDDNRDIYSMLLKQREEARISLAKSEREIIIKVVSPAIVPLYPIKPRKFLNIAMALLLGILVGCGLALLIDYFTYTINIPAELEKFRELAALEPAQEDKNGDMNSHSPPKKTETSI